MLLIHLLPLLLCEFFIFSSSWFPTLGLAFRTLIKHSPAEKVSAHVSGLELADSKALKLRRIKFPEANGKRKRPDESERFFASCIATLEVWPFLVVVAIMILVVIIPIAVGVPAVSVLIPPALPMRPAIFAGFVQFVAPVLRLLALSSVMFYRFVQFVICVYQSVLAAVRSCTGSSWQQQQSRGQRTRPQNAFPI